MTKAPTPMTDANGEYLLARASDSFIVSDIVPETQSAEFLGSVIVKTPNEFRAAVGVYANQFYPGNTSIQEDGRPLLELQQRILAVLKIVRLNLVLLPDAPMFFLAVKKNEVSLFAKAGLPAVDLYAELALEVEFCCSQFSENATPDLDVWRDYLQETYLDAINEVTDSKDMEVLETVSIDIDGSMRIIQNGDMVHGIISSPMKVGVLFRVINAAERGYASIYTQPPALNHSVMDLRLNQNDIVKDPEELIRLVQGTRFLDPAVSLYKQGILELYTSSGEPRYLRSQFTDHGISAEMVKDIRGATEDEPDSAIFQFFHRGHGILDNLTVTEAIARGGYAKELHRVARAYGH